MIIDQEKLFGCNNDICNGCSILQKPGDHSILDYEYESEVDILFVSDSLKMYQGEYVPFRTNEYSVITNTLRKFNVPKETKIGFTASVKCPNITNDSITTKDRKICRKHLEATIAQYKPKLVFACGKLAVTMMRGKNVSESNALGSLVDMEMAGHQFKMMYVFHPWQVVSEPKNKYLFDKNLESAINAVILNIQPKRKFTFEVIDSIGQIEKYRKIIGKDRLTPVSIDIETTGLNFLEDLIQTIAISWYPNYPETEVLHTITFGIDHPTVNYGWEMKAHLMKLTSEVCAASSPLVLQQCKFDMKFLKRYGVHTFTNVWDTKLMQHLVKEDVPKSLIDLCGYYFPEELA